MVPWKPRQFHLGLDGYRKHLQNSTVDYSFETSAFENFEWLICREREISGSMNIFRTGVHCLHS